MLPAWTRGWNWTLRLVGTGIEGQSRSFEVMVISRVGDIAQLGLTLAEASSAGGPCRAGPPPCDASVGLSLMRRAVPREGLAAALNCDAVP